MTTDDDQDQDLADVQAAWTFIADLEHEAERRDYEDHMRVCVALRQTHIFHRWARDYASASYDPDKHRLFRQLRGLNASYPGGLQAYTTNIRRLLSPGDNDHDHGAFDNWIPSLPSGQQPVRYPDDERCSDDDFVALEQLGVDQLPHTCFVLVAGGLGERLGYTEGIKLGLPVETLTHQTYLGFYCDYIRTYENLMSGTSGSLPLAIMVSMDTELKTRQLLEEHQYYGLQASQVHLIRQEKVLSVKDVQGTFAMDPADPFTLLTKPHGHGDVHLLMHQSGLASKWKHELGKKWVVFFQDTNALAVNAILPTLGTSARHQWQMNSVAIPRKAKDASGALMTLKNESGHKSSGKQNEEITINIEYNQLDRVLRASDAYPEGDVNDPTSGYSVFPGNINQLVIALETYVSVLEATAGIMSEFVNPKYTDASHTAFKSPTRLECMMQDYPKILLEHQTPTRPLRVGLTMFEQPHLVYSPCKNSIADAEKKVQLGAPAQCAASAEHEFFHSSVTKCHFLRGLEFGEISKELGDGHQMLHLSGTIPEVVPRTWCHLVWSAAFAPTYGHLVKRFPHPEAIRVSNRSSLILELAHPSARFEIQSLVLDGALRIRVTCPGVSLVVERLEVKNAGWTYRPSTPLDAEIYRLRGYVLEKQHQREYLFDQPGSYTINEVVEEKTNVGF